MGTKSWVGWTLIGFAVADVVTFEAAWAVSAAGSDRTHPVYIGGLVAAVVGISLVLWGAALRERVEPKSARGQQAVGGQEAVATATGHDAIAQQGAGPQVAVQGQGHTVHYHHYEAVQKHVEDGRVVVDVDPDHLTAFFKGDMTTLQADAAISHFIGAWMEVEGQLADVDQVADGYFVALSTDYAPGVYLVFSKDYRQRLAVMQKGKPIRALGRIKRVSQGSIVLEDCEFRA